MMNDVLLLVFTYTLQFLRYFIFNGKNVQTWKQTHIIISGNLV